MSPGEYYASSHLTCASHRLDTPDPIQALTLSGKCVVPILSFQLDVVLVPVEGIATKSRQINSRVGTAQFGYCFYPLPRTIEL